MTYRICEVKECKKRANYNIKDEKGKYCATHKTPDMIDISHKKCEFENCKTRPSFGLKDYIMMDGNH